VARALPVGAVGDGGWVGLVAGTSRVEWSLTLD